MSTPLLELIALYIERDAVRWVTEPEVVSPHRGAIKNGVFGTEESRRSAVREDAKGVASVLMKLANEVRAGDTKRAFNLLRLSARHSPEAMELMLALDPSAKPWYPDADRNGDPVVPGKRYWWDPGSDNQGNAAGYHKEGVVTRVNSAGMAFAVWEQIGEANPAYWGRGNGTEEPDDDDYIDEVLEEIEGPYETCVPSTMLRPIRGAQRSRQ